jgi:hypothetical protein
MNSLQKIVSVFLVLISISISGQPISEILNQYVNGLRQSKSADIPNALLMEVNSLDVLDEVPSFLHDSLPNVRSGMYFLVGKIGIQSKQSAIKISAVDKLIAGRNDKNSGNVGLIWNILSKFKREDFTNASKDCLRFSLRSRSVHFDRLLKLIGYLQMRELIEEIRPLTLPPNNQQHRWAALLTLSRMGDSEAIQSVLQRVQKLKVNDESIYEVFPGLIYTHQREIFDYVLTILNSEEKNCFSAETESEVPILCGYRLMELLAPSIEAYPLELDSAGDIKTKNYEKALAEVRKWFRQNKTYRINNEVF